MIMISIHLVLEHRYLLSLVGASAWAAELLARIYLGYFTLLPLYMQALSGYLLDDNLAFV